MDVTPEANCWMNADICIAGEFRGQEKDVDRRQNRKAGCPNEGVYVPQLLSAVLGPYSELKTWVPGFIDLLAVSSQDEKKNSSRL